MRPRHYAFHVNDVFSIADAAAEKPHIGGTVVVGPKLRKAKSSGVRLQPLLASSNISFVARISSNATLCRYG